MTGQELKAYLNAKGWSYRELSERIGYTESAIAQAIKRGEVTPTMSKAIELVEKIAELEARAQCSANEYAQLKSKGAAFDTIIAAVATAIKHS